MDKRTETKHIWDFVKDTPEDVFHKQQELWMINSPAKRLEMTLKFIDSSLEWNKAGLRSQHPEWTEKQLLNEQFRQNYKHDYSPEILDQIITFLNAVK